MGNKKAIVKKDVKNPRWLQRNGFDGRLIAKILITMIRVNLGPNPNKTWRKQHNTHELLLLNFFLLQWLTITAISWLPLLCQNYYIIKKMHSRVWQFLLLILATDIRVCCHFIFKNLNMLLRWIVPLVLTIAMLYSSLHASKSL